MFGFLTVVAVFIFVTGIVRMALTHAERIERIKHGYPISDDGSKLTKEDYVDYTDQKN